MEALVKQRQIEIESSIQREEAALAAITESLESADHMTNQMENILANFGSRHDFGFIFYCKHFGCIFQTYVILLKQPIDSQ